MLKRIQFYKKNHINVSNVSCNFMSNEFRKCNFCSYYDEYEWC